MEPRRVIRLLVSALTTAAVIPFVGACVGHISDPVAPTGKLRATLSATTPDGIEYRLRNGGFIVTGPENTELTAETHLGERAVELELPMGSYSIRLFPGWSLERGQNGTFAPVDATLSSADIQTFQIAGDDETDVTFTFSADGHSVDL